MSMVNDIIWGYEDNETECTANSTLVSLFAKRFLAGRWSFLGPGSETKWYSTDKERPGRQRDGQGDGVPKAGPKQAAVDSRGSRTLRVCKHLSWGIARAGRGRMN